MEDLFDNIDRDDEQPEEDTISRKDELFKIIQDLEKRGALTTQEEMQLNTALAEYRNLL